MQQVYLVAYGTFGVRDIARLRGLGAQNRTESMLCARTSCASARETLDFVLEGVRRKGTPSVLMPRASEAICCGDPAFQALLARAPPNPSALDLVRADRKAAGMIAFHGTSALRRWMEAQPKQAMGVGVFNPALIALIVWAHSRQALTRPLPPGHIIRMERGVNYHAFDLPPWFEET